MPDTRQELCLEYGEHLLVSLLLVLLHGRGQVRALFYLLRP